MRDPVGRARDHLEGHRLAVAQALAQGHQLRLGIYAIDLVQKGQCLVPPLQLAQDLHAGDQAQQVAARLGLLHQAVGGLVIPD